MLPFTRPAPLRTSRARLRLRLLKIQVALLTGCVAGWLVSLGPIPGIIGLVTAKHILVAVFLAQPDEEAESIPSDEDPDEGGLATPVA